MPFDVISYFCYRYFILYWNQIDVLHSIWNFVLALLLTFQLITNVDYCCNHFWPAICAVHSKLVVEWPKVPYHLSQSKFFVIFGSPIQVVLTEFFRGFSESIYFARPRLVFLTDVFHGFSRVRLFCKSPPPPPGLVILTYLFFLSPYFLASPRSVTLTEVSTTFSDSLYFGNFSQYIRTGSSAWFFWVPLLCKSQTNYPGGSFSCFSFWVPRIPWLLAPTLFLIHNPVSHTVLFEMLTNSFVSLQSGIPPVGW